MIPDTHLYKACRGCRSSPKGPSIRARTRDKMAFTKTMSASMSGFSTMFWKSVQLPVVRPLTTLMNAWTSHFPTLMKNWPVATTAFHRNAATPVIVFHAASHRFGGGGGGGTAVQFPPFATDVFAASFDTSHENPRV